MNTATETSDLNEELPQHDAANPALKRLEPGDMIFAAKDISNDGSLPGHEEGALVAPAGRRGVLINTGHLEEKPNQEIYLVRFENDGGELGPAVACWPEELAPG
ncbi:MAG: nitrogen fixation protein NifZ [Gammaproteobacteria bacterium]